MPIFRRIAASPSLRVRVMAGTGIPGTKLSNAPDLSGIDARILWTIKKQIHSTGRNVLLTFNPTLPFHLLRFRPDVLLVQGGMVLNNLITLFYAKITGTPIVWWSLGQVHGRDFKGLSLLYHRLNKWIERKATCYAGYSSTSVDYFIGQGYPADRCFNLVNVVDTELVEKQIDRYRDRVADLRRELGIDGKRVVLFVGSLTEPKCIGELVRAFSMLPELRKNTRLLIVGDGPERAPTEQLARDLELGDEVIFVGSVYEGVEAYFQVADLLVLPGTGGLAISEGMTHGLPVICSIGDGVEVDLIDEGVNGFRVEPNNTDQLAEKMRIALQSPERLRDMGYASRRIISERANIDRYMNEMLSAIFYAHSHRRGGQG
jgi:glycosyltransferase involved in cell wall biosynthesis